MVSMLYSNISNIRNTINNIIKQYEQYMLLVVSISGIGKKESIEVSKTRNIFVDI
jgi:hypothetical protein